jgi:hypothetical protein
MSMVICIPRQRMFVEVSVRIFYVSMLEQDKLNSYI